MDKLTRYIHTGTGYGLKKMVMISFVFCVVAIGLLYTALNRLPDMLEKDPILDDMPTIRIQNGQVVQPADTVWTKDVDTGTPFILKIDTSRDSMDKTPEENGVYLTRRALYLKSMNQVQLVDLPQEELVLNKPILIDILRNSIHTTVIVLTLFILSLLWMGFAGTTAITTLILWVIQKQVPTGAAARASLIGWLAIITLDFALLIFGFGFSLTTAVFIAALIALFGLFRPAADS